MATTDPDANGVELAQSVVINGSAGGLKPSQSLSAESSSETSEIKERCVTITGTDQQIFKVLKMASVQLRTSDSCRPNSGSSNEWPSTRWLSLTRRLSTAC